MANLKRNMIELVKNPEEVNNGGEVEIERFWTPTFIPMKTMYEALDISDEFTNFDRGKSKHSERELMDMMMDFVANKVYNRQFTKDDLLNKLHAPDAMYALGSQIHFVSQGGQSESTKNFLAKKN